jgi:RNA polymerase sigma-70 factor (ECF subfamily)
VRAERVIPRRERALVRAAQRGDEAALEGLFRMHWPAAYRAAWFVVRDEQVAEDIAQEAFLAAVAALDRFDRRRPFGPWLRTIVARRAIDALRARAVRREVGDDALGALPAPERAAEASRTRGDALALLPDDQRVAVVLRHLLELTPGEIAALLDVPRGHGQLAAAPRPGRARAMGARDARRRCRTAGGRPVKRRDDPLDGLRAPARPARRRAWAAASAAHRARLPARRRRVSALLTAALAVVAGILAVTAPGSAVATWVGDTVRAAVDRTPEVPRRATELDGCRAAAAARRRRHQHLGSRATGVRGRSSAAWTRSRGRRTGASSRRPAGASSRSSTRAARGAGTWSASGGSGRRHGRGLTASASPTSRAHSCAWSPATAATTGSSRAPIPRSPRRGGRAATTSSRTSARVASLVADVDSARRVFAVPAPRSARLAFSSGGQHLLVAGPREIRVHEGRTGRLLQRLAAPRACGVPRRGVGRWRAGRDRHRPSGRRARDRRRPAHRPDPHHATYLRGDGRRERGRVPRRAVAARRLARRVDVAVPPGLGGSPSAGPESGEALRHGRRAGRRLVLPRPLNRARSHR